MAIGETMENVLCDSCRSAGSKVLFGQKDLMFNREEIFYVVKCIKCGLLYTNPRPKIENIGNYYEENYYDQNSPSVVPVEEKIGKLENKDLPEPISWKQKFRRRLSEECYGYPRRNSSADSATSFWLRILFEIERFRLKISGREKGIIPYRGNGRVLDVGCGTGEILNGLRAEGFNPFGVEINPRAVKTAKEKFQLEVVCGTLFDAKYPDNFFDIILFNHSLEHFYSPLRVLKECFRILNPEGMIMISVPNSRSLEAFIFKSFWFSWDLPRHLYHFSPKTLLQELFYAGFKIHKALSDTGTATFLQSVEYLYKYKYHKPFRYRKIIKFLAGPLTYMTGLLGFGGSCIIIAEKKNKITR
jgi:SAM-dependent methyltransferase